MRDMINLAAKAAMTSDPFDQRNYLLGAIGIRKDGTVVSSKNGAVFSTLTFADNWTIPTAHAEVRLCRKLGRGGIVYLARVARKDGSLVMSRPCNMCRTILKSHYVKKVYYSINSKQYGRLDVLKERDEVYNF
jgi:tRNA(Arg) A34 adenosine deaminase TadA